jgi:hypothetical protein
MVVHSTLRLRAGETSGFLIYIETVIFVVASRAFLRSGREYLRERGRAPRLLTGSDYLARHYQLLALIIGVALLVSYALVAALYGGGIIYFFHKAKLSIFVVGGFIALNGYLDIQSSSRLVAVLDGRRAHPNVTGKGN